MPGQQPGESLIIVPVLNESLYSMPSCSRRDILITTLLLTHTLSHGNSQEEEEEEDHKPQVSSKVRVSLH